MGDREADGTDPIDVARLVARAREGDESAYEILMRRHFRAAFAVARAGTLSEMDAEDVCQSAFFTAYQRLGDCTHPERFGAWLLRIVRNQAANRRAHEGLRTGAALEEAHDAAAHPSAGPEARLERRELRRTLLAALATLAPASREAILLHDVEGFTHGEIARLLDLSETMSRRHVSDGRRRLRELLQGELRGGTE